MYTLLVHYYNKDDDSLEGVKVLRTVEFLCDSKAAAWQRLQSLDFKTFELLPLDHPERVDAI